jgi:major membrane immunogen (membrane-anchored lipoprotein)
MKILRIPFSLVIPVMLFTASSFCYSQDLKNPDKVLPDTSMKSIIYYDGTYEGQSQASYIGEPYWGRVVFTLTNGKFSDIFFTVRDSSLHETFDGNYEKHFQGNQIYIQQCRNDWNGVQVYPIRLSEAQDPDKVDAVSGATWSYNIFRASAKEALKNAKK